MALGFIDNSVFGDIADAIRAKTGKSAAIAPADMPDEIESISGGTMQSKTLTLGSAAPSTISPDSGYDGLSSVPVSIDSSVIKADNIAEGATILGVAGTHSGGGSGGTASFSWSGVRLYVGSYYTFGYAHYYNTSGTFTQLYSSTSLSSFSVSDVALGSCMAIVTKIYSPSIVCSGCEAVYFRDTNQAIYLVHISSANATIVGSECFLPDTLITMADGSKRMVKDLTYDDELKVWDFDKGAYSTSTICWLTKSGLLNNHYYKITFSDGTVLKTTGQNSNHKLYSVDDRYFKGVNIIEAGERIFSENGIVTVVSNEYVEEEVEYYNLITSKNICCFANGILASDRYGNLYEIDENMKYIKDERPVRPYSEFEAVGIKEYWYEPLRLSEGTQTAEEVKDYILKLECQMLPIE